MRKRIWAALVGAVLIAGLMPLVAMADHGELTPQGNCPEEGKIASVVDGDLNGIIPDAGTHVCVKGGSDDATLITADGVKTLEELLNNGHDVSHYTVIQEPIDYCDPANKPGGISLAAWLEQNGNPDCIDLEVEAVCGMVTGTITRDETPEAWNWAVAFEVAPATYNLGNAEFGSMSFEEDFNGGSVEVAYYLVGPEEDYGVISGEPNFWMENALTITVDTDCEEEVTTTTMDDTTTTTMDDTTTTAQVIDSTITTMDDTTTTVQVISTTTPTPDGTLPFTGIGSTPLALMAIGLVALGALGLVLSRRTEDQV